MLAWPLVAVTKALRATWLIFLGDGPDSMSNFTGISISILLLVLPSEFQGWSHIPFLVNNWLISSLELQHNESEAYDCPYSPSYSVS